MYLAAVGVDTNRFLVFLWSLNFECVLFFADAVKWGMMWSWAMGLGELMPSEAMTSFIENIFLACVVALVMISIVSAGKR